MNPRIDLRGIIEDVDSSKPPQNVVTGSKLKTVWYDMWGTFTTALANWEESGQNDQSTHDFLKFALIKSNGELRTISKRLITMFIVMRIAPELGTEVAAMRNLTVRTIPHGAGSDATGTVTVGGSVLNLG